MIRTAVLLAASLFAAPLIAQEQIYIYVSYKDAKGASFRHQLDCIDLRCRVKTRSAEHFVTLTDAQQKALLDALQAELKHFVVAADSASRDQRVKVKLRYETPSKRVDMTRRLPNDEPADVTPEMLQVIETHLDLDLSKPVSPKSSEQDEARSEPASKGQSQ